MLKSWRRHQRCLRRLTRSDYNGYEYIELYVWYVANAVDMVHMVLAPHCLYLTRGFIGNTLSNKGFINGKEPRNRNIYIVEHSYILLCKAQKSL